MSGLIQIARVPGSDCSGVPVNRAAATAARSELDALEAEFFACLGSRYCWDVLPNECISDCLAGSRPACNAAHQCAPLRQSTCPPQPDAGPLMSCLEVRT